MKMMNFNNKYKYIKNNKKMNCFYCNKNMKNINIQSKNHKYNSQNSKFNK